MINLLTNDINASSTTACEQAHISNSFNDEINVTNPQDELELCFKVYAEYDPELGEFTRKIDQICLLAIDEIDLNEDFEYRYSDDGEDAVEEDDPNLSPTYIDQSKNDMVYGGIESNSFSKDVTPKSYQEISEILKSTITYWTLACSINQSAIT